MPPGFGCPDGGFCLWLGKEIQYPLIPLFASFLNAVVRPNAILFGWVATVTEVFIGLTLVFGLFTRLGALVGVWWSLNLLIGLAAVPNEHAWYYLSMVMFCLLFIAVGGSGQIAADRAKRWPMGWSQAEPNIGGID